MAFLRKILILFSKSKVYNLLHAQEFTKSSPRTTDVCYIAKEDLVDCASADSHKSLNIYTVNGHRVITGKL